MDRGYLQNRDYLRPAALAIVFSVLYIASPSWYSSTFHKISTAIDNNDSEAVAINQTQAKFVNLDGKVLGEEGGFGAMGGSRLPHFPR